MTSTISLSEALRFLDTFCEFVIINDIPAAINGQANYLAALGLSTYTEVLGGLYCGDLSGKGKDLNKHYTSFIRDFFHPDYMKVNSNLINDGLKGLYGAVRSGLTHEYFIKKISKVEMNNPTPLNCGITYDKNSSPQIIFYVTQYFSDFKIAIKEYYKKLKGDQYVLTNFSSALHSINSSLIAKISGDIKKDVSGNIFAS
jgi:hypothetical protein